ncbi:50S ribosomal protein L35 [candidate division WOR-3 bacterium 4484_100]|uniref:Large ribosomal subunit protein bL35 n=1 Tax=candidate division WOR-3 bacterium 4484_100 TaxID=1936077 RepID=A0A1V4QGM6_UNCW3|nr:MAG: 50S ribosomal protein L35 [candidate division WOR-3 bacterium 4484_100]
MAKQKSKRGLLKRIKKRKSGSIARHRAGKSHLLTGKKRKRKRRLRQAASFSRADEKRIKKLI